MATFAFASNVRLHRFSSLSGTATTLRTELKADVIDGGLGSESLCTVGYNGDMVGQDSIKQRVSRVESGCGRFRAV